MALINRVSRLFKADFHAVLDRIEEPELVLQQAIRDMEEELSAAEQQIGACEHEDDALQRRASELGDKLAEIDSELDLCFANGKDDLARSLVRRKLEAERLNKRVVAKRAGNADTLEKLRARTTDNRAALESLKQKAEIFAQQTPSGSEGREESSWLARDFVVSDDEIEVAFLREREARSGS